MSLSLYSAISTFSLREDFFTLQFLSSISSSTILCDDLWLEIDSATAVLLRSLSIFLAVKSVNRSLEADLLLLPL